MLNNGIEIDPICFIESRKINYNCAILIEHFFIHNFILNIFFFLKPFR